MNTYSRFIAYVTLAAGLIGISGCDGSGNHSGQESTTEQSKKPTVYTLNEAFAQFDEIKDLSVTKGDFDGDGDLDLIISGYGRTNDFDGVLYQFVNDGKGTFTIKAPQKPAEAPDHSSTTAEKPEQAEYETPFTGLQPGR